MISLGLLGMGGRPAWRPKDSWCDGRKGGQHGGQRIAGVTEGKGANMFTDKFLILPFSGVLGAVLNAKVNFVEDMDEILNEAFNRNEELGEATLSNSLSMHYRKVRIYTTNCDKIGD